jgi:hypothetical protein
VKRAAVGILLASTYAHADERAATINLAASAGSYQSTQTDGYTVVTPGLMFGSRVTFAWEHAPLDYPESGIRRAFELVPELFGGGFVKQEEGRAEAFLGAGVRADIKIANRGQFFGTSARGSVYLAARGLIVGEQRTPHLEFALGQFFLFRKTSRVGYELAGMWANAEEMAGDVEREFEITAFTFQLYYGWRP